MDYLSRSYELATGLVGPVLANMPNGTAQVVAYAAAPIVGYYGLPLALGYAGFTAAGPVVGSYAAAWQSSIGVVQAGSAFATVQGAVMTGTANVVGGAVGAIVPVVGWIWGRNTTQTC